MALDRPEWGRADWDEEWLSFVHGTTLETFDVTNGIVDVGAGDFGSGFYTYLASGRLSSWGINKAFEWACRKASEKRQTPCLVYVKVACDVFQTMTLLTCDQHDCQPVHARYDPYTRTDYELVVGPVGKRQSGQKAPDRSKPPQFKFEGLGLAGLTIDRLPQGE